MTIRNLLTWKTWFYKLLLPRLASIDAARSDAILSTLGKTIPCVWLPRRFALERAVQHAANYLGMPAGPGRSAWVRSLRTSLAENAARFLARDVLLDTLSDEAALERFACDGWGHLSDALRKGRGAILVGCHFGGYLAALHALYRRAIPLRVLLQRPQHVSGYLSRHLDKSTGPHPQVELMLKRRLEPRAAADALLRARAVLRDGMALALFGDIPWSTGRLGYWLGQQWTFQTSWIDLACATGATVLPFYCLHAGGGTYRLSILPPLPVDQNAQQAALDDYLALLEQWVRSHPQEAVAYWTWPAYRRAHRNPQRAAVFQPVSPAKSANSVQLAS